MKMPVICQAVGNIFLFQFWYFAIVEMPGIDPSLLEAEDKANNSDADISGISNPDLSQTGSENEAFNDVAEQDTQPEQVAESNRETSKPVLESSPKELSDITDRPSLPELPEAALSALGIKTQPQCISYMACPYGLEFLRIHQLM